MKISRSLIAAFAAGVALTMAFSGCNNTNEKSTAGQGTYTTADGEISNLKISEIVKSASKSYRMTAPEDTSFLTLSTTVQWPEEIGDADIMPLQSEILSAAFSSTETTDVDHAIVKFIGSSDEWIDSTAYKNVEVVPTPAPGIRDYQVEVTADINELTGRTITYFVTSSTYLGGAHPNTVLTPFTYNLEKGQVITYADLFGKDKENAIGKLITSALAAEYNVAPDRLTDAGFFNNTVPATSTVYIQNNMIYFHYNAYEIAPYSFGMIDVPVAPYEVKDLLTPYYKEFFEN